VKKIIQAIIPCAVCFRMNRTAFRQTAQKISMRKSGRVLAVILSTAILALVSACFSDSGTNPEPAADNPGDTQQPDVTVQPDPTQQQFTIDQAGGTVIYNSTLHDVTVTLVIPPGALDGSTVITIEHAQNFPGGHRAGYGRRLRLWPRRAVVQYSGRTQHYLQRRYDQQPLRG